MKNSLGFLFALLFSFNALTIYAQEKWTCYSDDDTLLTDDHHGILGAFEYKDGTFWIVTTRGINVFDGEKWKRIDQKTGLMKKAVASYLLDSKNNIWVGSGSPEFGYGPADIYHGGVALFDGKDWKLMLTKEMGLKAAIVSRIFESSTGDIWIQISNLPPGAEETSMFVKGGLLHYTNNEFKIYRAKDVPCLNCNYARGFYEDDTGRIWMWTGKGSIMYYEDGKFTRVTKENGYPILGRRVMATFVDSKKNFWLAGLGRVVKYDGNSWTRFNRKNGLPSSSFFPQGFAENSDGKIFLGINNGVYEFDGKEEWTRDKKQFISSSIFIDKDDRIWVPAVKGLEVRDGSEVSKDKDLQGVWGILEDNNGGTWAFTRNNGAKRLKDGNWTYYTDKNQLPSNKLTMAHVTNDGTLWVGTKKGICKCEYD